MSDTIIKVENLSKRYILSHQEATSRSYVALRDVLADSVKRAGTSIRRAITRPKMTASNPTREEFWALQDISFEMHQGDRLGIIGRNGAGKSTLLKVLSRITEPTKGRISIRGRVASLLEVGTGFHPELSGRENIYLNGAILGMTRSEIRRKFDAMVEFAEVERFLDTPVKRYSSGMYVRLAFSVAAHLEPEILIVDEVLAVGDAQFQKKCLGKMEEVGKEGRTVIFVSHNMNAIEQLCGTCLLIDKGRIKAYGDDVRGLVKQYLHGEFRAETESEWTNRGSEFGNPWFTPLRFYIGDEQGHRHTNPVRNDSDMWITVEGKVEKKDHRLSLGYAIYDHDHVMLYQSASHDESTDDLKGLAEGVRTVKTRIPSRFLNEGDYRIVLMVFLHAHSWICHYQDPKAPSITLTIQGGLSDSAHWTTRRAGSFAPVMKWLVDSD